MACSPAAPALVTRSRLRLCARTLPAPCCSRAPSASQRAWIRTTSRPSTSATRTFTGNVRRPRLHPRMESRMTAKAFEALELWFVAGSHELYGEAALAEVDADAREVAAGLNAADQLPVRVVHRPVVSSPSAIRDLCIQANSADSCVGLIVWMHTFSPGKMWIAGLSELQRPLLHLHTQFNAALPWSEIDMDYMNLHQSAHGDREFGFMAARMGLRRKIVAGHGGDAATLGRIGAWSRAACGWRGPQRLSVARFGDNMRQVAVTEGDKV